MTRLRRYVLTLAVCAVSALGIATASLASSDDPIVICHGTASGHNPYVQISVDHNALAGHFDGTEPGHGQNNHPDFLANGGDCSGE